MIDWSKQHNGVRKATFEQVLELMPDLEELVKTFPENPYDFYWDIKVHMLMPNQYPCIPNWHFDNVPRGADGKQDFSQVDESKPMYLWISGAPLTEFKVSYKYYGKGKLYETKEEKIPAGEWYKFTQKCEHRGTMATEFTWRGFIRATHKDLSAKNPSKDHDPLRRHSQVYLDSKEFTW